MNNKRRMIQIAIVVLLQCLVIGSIIFRYERVVKYGAVLRLPCQAYDPSDPLRGRYLQTTVRCDFPTTPKKDVLAGSVRRQHTWFVQITPSEGPNDISQLTDVSDTPTAQGIWVRPKKCNFYLDYHELEKEPDETWEEFQQRAERDRMRATVLFPDKLFLNEKKAPELDDVLRGNVDKAVAVYRAMNHDIILVDIEINGVSILQAAN